MTSPDRRACLLVIAHSQREHADWLVGVKHAAYLLMVKANQPILHHQLRRLAGATSLSRTTPATAATAGSKPAASRSPPSPASTSRTPPKPYGPLAGPGRFPAGAGEP